MTKLSVIIVSWNTKNLLKEAVASLYDDLNNTEIKDFEVFVVDNNSNDGSVEMIRHVFPQVNLIANQENLGFGKANNQALKICNGEFVLLLNPDTQVIPRSISSLLKFAENHPKAGIVAPQLLNDDGSIQRSCRAFPTFQGMFYELSGLSRMFPKVEKFRQYKMLDFDHTQTREVDQPEGACLLVRKQALTEVGIFDEKFFMLFEEVDLCYRIKKADWEIWFNPESKIIHYYGQSIKQVKAKMIVSSHKGMFYYWSKHNQQWYHRAIKPFFYIFLAGLAIMRIVILKIKAK